MKRLFSIVASIAGAIRELQFLRKEIPVHQLFSLDLEQSDEYTQWQGDDPHTVSIIKQIAK